MTQTEALINYLEKYGSITTYQSFTELFITRLSAKIYELKHKYGYEFEEKWVVKQNIYGNTCSFKKYIWKRGE